MAKYGSFKYSEQKYGSTTRKIIAMFGNGIISGTKILAERVLKTVALSVNGAITRLNNVSKIIKLVGVGLITRINKISKIIDLVGTGLITMLNPTVILVLYKIVNIYVAATVSKTNKRIKEVIILSVASIKVGVYKVYKVVMLYAEGILNANILRKAKYYVLKIVRFITRQFKIATPSNKVIVSSGNVKKPYKRSMNELILKTSTGKSILNTDNDSVLALSDEEEVTIKKV